MNLRSSNSVAALALLVAGGGCALFAPAARAGDHLEFSTPAIPLSVPHPDVEIKETKKMTGAADMTAGMTGGIVAGSMQQIVTSKSKSKDRYDLNSKDGFGLESDDKYGLGSKDKYDLDSRDKYDLDSDSLLRDAQEKHDPFEWLNAGQDPGRATNSGSLNMPREWDAKDSNSLLQRRNEFGAETGPNASRFGSPIGFERERAWDSDRNAQDNQRYGRDASSDKDYSSWIKAPNHDSSGTDRFNAARFATPKDESVSFGFSVNEPRKTEPAPAADSTSALALPPGFGNFTPFDGSQNRQIGEAFGGQTGASPELRAWEPATSGSLPARMSSNPALNASTRVVAPNRPVNLPFPKRPDSP
jgi:hypothetical protein